MEDNNDLANLKQNLFPDFVEDKSKESIISNNCNINVINSLLQSPISNNKNSLAVSQDVNKSNKSTILNNLSDVNIKTNHHFDNNCNKVNIPNIKNTKNNKNINNIIKTDIHENQYNKKKSDKGKFQISTTYIKDDNSNNKKPISKFNSNSIAKKVLYTNIKRSVVLKSDPSYSQLTSSQININKTTNQLSVSNSNNFNSLNNLNNLNNFYSNTKDTNSQLNLYITGSLNTNRTNFSKANKLSKDSLNYVSFIPNTNNNIFKKKFSTNKFSVETDKNIEVIKYPVIVNKTNSVWNHVYSNTNSNLDNVNSKIGIIGYNKNNEIRKNTKNTGNNEINKKSGCDKNKSLSYIKETNKELNKYNNNTTQKSGNQIMHNLSISKELSKQENNHTNNNNTINNMDNTNNKLKTINEDNHNNSKTIDSHINNTKINYNSKTTKNNYTTYNKFNKKKKHSSNYNSNNYDYNDENEENDYNENTNILFTDTNYNTDYKYKTFNNNKKAGKFHFLKINNQTLSLKKEVIYENKSNISSINGNSTNGGNRKPNFFQTSASYIEGDYCNTFTTKTNFSEQRYNKNNNTFLKTYNYNDDFVQQDLLPNLTYNKSKDNYTADVKNKQYILNKVNNEKYLLIQRKFLNSEVDIEKHTKNNNDIYNNFSIKDFFTMYDIKNNLNSKLNRRIQSKF